ncbi:MAG TPA: hypothetical protein VJA47_04345 [archaeon]|nr:hypothetical protein [archaeon]
MKKEDVKNTDAVRTYLKDLQEFPKYVLTEEDKKSIQSDRVMWMTRKLLLKRFRKTKLYEETEKDILNKITLSIEKDEPVHLIILFGGYKHFWNPSYPRVDWAELFNLRFMSELVAPLLTVHKPGVVLDYGSEDVIMTMMDNYPEKDLDAYASSFEELLEFYTKYVPSNFKISYVRTGRKYDSDKLKNKITESLPNKRTEWDKLSSEEKEKRLKRSRRSLVWNGQEDWTKLNQKEREEKIIVSKIIEDTFYEVEAEFLGDYFTGGTHIPVVLSWGLSDENATHWLTLGSTFASTTDFWIGRGVLEIQSSRIVPRVVSQKQYGAIKDRLQKISVKEFTIKGFGSIETGESISFNGP